MKDLKLPGVGSKGVGGSKNTDNDNEEAGSLNTETGAGGGEQGLKKKRQGASGSGEDSANPSCGAGESGFRRRAQQEYDLMQARKQQTSEDLWRCRHVLQVSSRGERDFELAKRCVTMAADFVLEVLMQVGPLACL